VGDIKQEFMNNTRRKFHTFSHTAGKLASYCCGFLITYEILSLVENHTIYLETPT